MKKFITENEAQTIKLGQKLGQVLKGGDIIILDGDLGGGKTTFSKGIALGLGVKEDVTSPTFSIEQIYRARSGLAIFHYDFYRLKAGDITEMEFLENLDNPQAIFLVEWGDIIRKILPANYLEIKFTYLGENKREIEMIPIGEKHKKEIDKL